MKHANKALRELGFSEYEAATYCGLLAVAPANGYQVAKVSGVPRSKVYECLEKLVARGAAVPVETKDKTTTYAPTDPVALIDDFRNSMNTVMDEAKRSLLRVQHDANVVEVLWRVNSHADLVTRGQTLIEEASETLHVALWANEFGDLIEELCGAAERGVKMALMLYDAHDALTRLQQLGVGAWQHSVSKQQTALELGRQFAVVADRERCITGSIFEKDRVEGAYTMNRGLVTNVIDLVNHEIYVERMLAEVGKPVTDLYGDDLALLDPFLTA